MSNKREAYWDNLKCVLMLLVVIGHAAEEYITIPFWRGVHLFIYSFHMPVFVFVSVTMNSPKIRVMKPLPSLKTA